LQIHAKGLRLVFCADGYEVLYCGRSNHAGFILFCLGISRAFGGRMCILPLVGAVCVGNAVFSCFNFLMEDERSLSTLLARFVDVQYKT